MENLNVARPSLRPKRVLPNAQHLFARFFCGPNAKKSDALAKQQKKRPRVGEANETDSDDEDEDFEVKKKGRTPKTASAKKSKQSGEKLDCASRALCSLQDG